MRRESNPMAIQGDLDLYDNDPSDEGIDDISLGSEGLRNAVLYNTDWTVETVLNQISKGTIDLAPSFQRRDAWSLEVKSLFIESILLNFPIPSITLAETGSSKKFIVVDGKQRLSTLAQFFGNLPSSKFDKFKLRGLEDLRHLNSMDFDAICEFDPDLITQLENYTIRTNVIRGWKDDDVLYSIFYRLNSKTVKLSSQELRQSLHPGPYTVWLNEYAPDSFALRKLFPGPEPDFRLRDMEILARYLAFYFFVEDYSGNLKKFIDKSFSVLNRDWVSMQSRVQDAAVEFEESYALSTQIFSESLPFRKWNGDGWENRFNRAIFDAVMYSLKKSDDRRKISENCDVVLSLFKEVCLDPDFRDSIERTTKTTTALVMRTNKWCESLKSIGIECSLLRLDGRRIVFEK